MNIRKAKPEELAYIREQRVRAYEEYINLIPEGHWQALRKSILSETDQESGVDLLVAETDGRIAGSIALFPAKMDAYDGMVEELEYPEIRMLAVAPEHRGKGAAAALVTACIRLAKVRGYGAIGLHTGSFMANAAALYERFGFQRLPQHDFQPLDDGILVKAYRLSLL
ncbi:GNAT family N-acetyltransferase [Ectobacillus ponti]|uniref:GNAT family N-acetyltransferase n=1 Tax=Ectobacillus ponti TaxID=2961894 RepID=A0AA41XFR4_9BACI|nr:GNAT family N-acetyltransferase [Ectobacillus ponti]MCP8971296.1 GNAT family N-acetyltransferase [Ectobacillus ponti]